MAERLGQAEAAVGAGYDSLSPEEKIAPETSESGASFEKWSAIREQHHS
jgi:hypothetical protein